MISADSDDAWEVSANKTFASLINTNKYCNILSNGKLELSRIMHIAPDNFHLVLTCVFVEPFQKSWDPV